MLGHLFRGRSLPHAQLLQALILFSWSRMYSRTTASSRPTVETRNPRAQKLWPTEFCFHSPYTRSRRIALLPFIPKNSSCLAAVQPFRGASGSVRDDFGPEIIPQGLQRLPDQAFSDVSAIALRGRSDTATSVERFGSL